MSDSEVFNNSNELVTHIVNNVDQYMFLPIKLDTFAELDDEDIKNSSIAAKTFYNKLKSKISKELEAIQMVKSAQMDEKIAKNLSKKERQRLAKAKKLAVAQEAKSAVQSQKKQAKANEDNTVAQQNESNNVSTEDKNKKSNTNNKDSANEQNSTEEISRTDVINLEEHKQPVTASKKNQNNLPPNSSSNELSTSGTAGNTPRSKMDDSNQNVTVESEPYRYGSLRIKKFLSPDSDFDFALVDRNLLFADWKRQIQGSLDYLNTLSNRITDLNSFFDFHTHFTDFLFKLDFETLFVIKTGNWLPVHYWENEFIVKYVLNYLFPDIPSSNNKYGAFMTYEAVKRKKCGLLMRSQLEKTRNSISISQFSSPAYIHDWLNEVYDYHFLTFNSKSIKKMTLLQGALQKLFPQKFEQIANRWHEHYNVNISVNDLAKLCQKHLEEQNSLSNKIENSESTPKSTSIQRQNDESKLSERKRSSDKHDISAMSEIYTASKRRKSSHADMNERGDVNVITNIPEHHKNDTDTNNTANESINSGSTVPDKSNNTLLLSVTELAEIHSDQSNLDSYDYKNYDSKRIQEEWRKKIGTKFFNLLNDLTNVDQRTFPGWSLRLIKLLESEHLSFCLINNFNDGRESERVKRIPVYRNEEKFLKEFVLIKSFPHIESSESESSYEYWAKIKAYYCPYNFGSRLDYIMNLKPVKSLFLSEMSLYKWLHEIEKAFCLVANHSYNNKKDLLIRGFQTNFSKEVFYDKVKYWSTLDDCGQIISKMVKATTEFENSKSNDNHNDRSQDDNDSKIGSHYIDVGTDRTSSHANADESRFDNTGNTESTEMIPYKRVRFGDRQD